MSGRQLRSGLRSRKRKPESEEDEEESVASEEEEEEDVEEGEEEEEEENEEEENNENESPEDAVDIPDSRSESSHASSRSDRSTNYPAVRMDPGAGPMMTARDLRKQNEVRRQYSELIETCQSFRDRDTIGNDLKDEMVRNIKQSTKLFKEIGSGPGDMYMAFLHTKMCSGMILSKTEKIGNSASGFLLETFLAGLMEKSQGEGIAEYSPTHAIRMISSEASAGMKTVPSLVVLLGSFDRKSILSTPESREKKPKTPRRRPLDESVEATHAEEIRFSDEKGKRKKEGPEVQAQQILSVLTEYKNKTNAPCNLIQFAMDRTSLSHFFENLFYISFLVRDGYVSLVRKASRKKNLDELSLYIAPEKPPQKSTKESDDEVERSQCIFSFNSKKFKELAKECEGPPLIPERPRSSSSKRRRH